MDPWIHGWIQAPISFLVTYKLFKPLCTVTPPPKKKSLQPHMELYAPGWDPAIKPAICFSLNAASSGISDLHLEATSDLDASDYAVRLCEVRVTSVGDSLPCLGTGKTVHQVRFYLVSVQEKLPFPPKYRERNGHSWAWVRASGCVCVRGLRVEGNSFLTPKGQEIFAGERRGGQRKEFLPAAKGNPQFAKIPSL